MSKVILAVYLVGSVVNPTSTKILLNKSVDLIHNLFGVVVHHLNAVS